MPSPNYSREVDFGREQIDASSFIFDDDIAFHAVFSPDFVWTNPVNESHFKSLVTDAFGYGSPATLIPVPILSVQFKFDPSKFPRRFRNQGFLIGIVGRNIFYDVATRLPRNDTALLNASARKKTW
jgi:hypothetical protein